MISGESYTDILAFFDVFDTHGTGSISTSAPVLIDVLKLQDKFNRPTKTSFTNVIRFIDGFNQLKQEDVLMLTDYFIVTNGTEFDDFILFNDLFSAAYYKPTRSLSDTLTFGSYFTYILVPLCP